jgi:hypothetical protein
MMSRSGNLVPYVGRAENFSDGADESRDFKHFGTFQYLQTQRNYYYKT